MKEKFLLFRIRTKKDPQAFAQIYDAYVEPIYRFVYFKVSSTEVAEDLTADTFLKAWQYLTGEREVPHLQALLYRIARNNVIDWYRAKAKLDGDVPLDEAMLTGAAMAGAEKLIKDTETKLQAEVVIERLHALRDEYREIIVMRYLDELSVKEIASALGKSPTNVRVTLHRAMHALGEALTHFDANGNARTQDRKPADGTS